MTSGAVISLPLVSDCKITRQEFDDGGPLFGLEYFSDPGSEFSVILQVPKEPANKEILRGMQYMFLEDGRKIVTLRDLCDMSLFDVAYIGWESLRHFYLTKLVRLRFPKNLLGGDISIQPDTGYIPFLQFH